jgi:hypothetical protein
MIQFNLLPDIKQKYIKTQHTKRLVIGVSFIISVISIIVFLVLVITVYVVQKKNINDLNNNIQSSSSELKNKPNLATILTLQSQLNSLASLDRQSPEASRLFGYLTQVTPTQATISDIQVEFGQSTILINGNASSLSVVNTFVDNLKYTTYAIAGQSGNQSAFSSVVLTSFGFGNSATASYSISMGFDPAIFNNADNITLTVGGNPPATASQQPSIIFSKGS